MHKCKLCFRSFSNGRALGGHMRSHMMNLAKQEEESSRTIQLSFEAESAPSSSSSSSSSEDDDDDDKGLCYGLKENPKRNMPLADPEFSGSVILQDRESETESSKNNPTRRRSNRVWQIGTFDRNYNTEKVHDRESALKKVKFDEQPSKTESWIENEPLSSVSDATTEEDVAFCLMMLSRDKWKTQNNQQQSLEEEEEEEEDDDDDDDDDEFEEHVKVSNNRLRKGMYKCETCNKVFRSYQALGGHRASHKKIRVNIKVDEVEIEGGIVEKKVHECPVCFRIFASGQALGGHKRTHVNGSATTTTIPVLSSMKIGKSLIDLNLPAPIDDDDDDVSQIENSAVSDTEFVKTH